MSGCDVVRDVKNTLLIALTYVATVIGAGFASGQEILSYFVVYGKKSIYSLMGVCVLFVVCALCVMLRVDKNDINGFGEYICSIAPKKACSFIKICVMLFMLVSFCSMVSGSGELFYSALKTSRVFGMCTMMLLCVVVFWFDIKAILTVNAILAPIMAVSLFLLGIYSFVFRDVATFGSGLITSLCKNYIVSGLIYASYNLLSAIVIIAGLKDVITSKRVCIGASIIGGGALFIISASIWVAIKLYYGKIVLGEIPLLSIVSRNGKTIEIIYSLSLYFSMFTTAISCGYGVFNYLMTSLKIKKLTAIIILIAVSCPILFLGFSGIVKYVYSLFGYLGIILIVYVLCDGVKMMGEK